MSEKLKPMGLFLDKFKEVNYEKYAHSPYVIEQLNHTDIETVVFSEITPVLIEDEGHRLRRSVNVNTPGYLVAYNQRWTTAFLLSPEVSTLSEITPVHIDTLAGVDYADVFTYYETPPNIDDLPVGTKTVQVRVKLGVSLPDTVPDKRQFLLEMLLPFSKYEFTKDNISFLGDDIYLLDTPTIYEQIRVFRFGIDPNYLNVPPTFYGKLNHG